MSKVSYTKLLKEAIAQEWDQTKTVDVKGPMTDPILGYDGDGELQTHKDAASVLERYYFKEKSGNDLIEHTDNEIDEVPADNVNKTKKDIEDEIDDGESGSATFKQEEQGIDVEANDDLVIEDDSVENTVIAKLISEMEEEEGEEEEESEEEESEEVEESEDVAMEELMRLLEADDEAEEGGDKEGEKLDIDKEMEGGAEEEEEEPAEVKEALDAINAIDSDFDIPHLDEDLDLDIDDDDLILEDEDLLETAGAAGYAPPRFKGAQKGDEEEELEEAFAIFKEDIEEEEEPEQISPKKVRV